MQLATPATTDRYWTCRFDVPHDTKMQSPLPQFIDAVVALGGTGEVRSNPFGSNITVTVPTKQRDAALKLLEGFVPDETLVTADF